MPACPKCQSEESKVVDSRPAAHYSIRRRRECLQCASRYTTHELSTDEWDRINAPHLPYLEISARRAILAWLISQSDLSGPANNG